MSRYTKVFSSVLFCILISMPFFAVAQSAADIELAKQLARQKGYSEEQITSMSNKLQGGDSQSSSQVSSSRAVDRNVSVGSVRNTGYDLTGNDNVIVMHSSNADYKKDLSIFGHYLFRSSNLNFLPSFNIPTPKSYKLSAGDEVVVDIWGAVVKSIAAEISPEGSIYIPDLGPVYLYGQTVQEAEKNLKVQLSKIYSGLQGEEQDTFIKLSLGRIKSVTVNVIGDVVNPGTFTLPSLSSIASVLHMAGGPNTMGSMRDIRLYRNNKLVTTLDLYEYLMDGNFEANLRLEDNDVIMVVPYKNMVNLTGAVKKPMRYELKDVETLSDLFTYAGGFTNNAYLGSVQVDRIKPTSVADGPTSETFNVLAQEFDTFKLQDGDAVVVRNVNGRFMNKVSIEGVVWRPGSYSLSDTLKTLKQLIIAAGGVREDAYLEKAYIYRYGEDRNKEMLTFSLKNVILGSENIELKPDDRVYIYNVNELKPNYSVSISGEVNRAGRFEFRDGMTLGDLILMANGITDAATLEKVEVARRIKNRMEPESVQELSDTIALVLSYNLLKNPQDVDAKLQPDDMVFIRRSVYNKPQEGIVITGEVNYPGTYVVEKNTVRLSDIVNRAEGFNKDAYVNGAKLTRVLTKEEFARLSIAMKIAKKQANDSTQFENFDIGDRFSIAIDLAAAVANPGSDADIVLRENDIISVPKYNNTVKISGGVLYPNTVTYNSHNGYKQYVKEAGGFLKEAMKGKIYMVHMNGSVAAKGSPNFKVQPGTEIVVPLKKEKKNTQALSTIMSMATSVTSLAAMVATIVSVTK